SVLRPAYSNSAMITSGSAVWWTTMLRAVISSGSASSRAKCSRTASRPSRRVAGRANGWTTTASSAYSRGSVSGRRAVTPSMSRWKTARGLANSDMLLQYKSRFHLSTAVQAIPPAAVPPPGRRGRTAGGSAGQFGGQVVAVQHRQGRDGAGERDVQARRAARPGGDGGGVGDDHVVVLHPLGERRRDDGQPGAGGGAGPQDGVLQPGLLQRRRVRAGRRVRHD